MIRTRGWSYLLLLPVFVLLMGARQVPLTDPEPIAIPAGMSAQQVVKAIKAGLVGRTWEVTEEQPGRILSQLHLRSHVAKIELTYDDTAITIRYLDSVDLMYEEKKGQRYIHRNYLNWIANLRTDISRNLVLMSS